MKYAGSKAWMLGPKAENADSFEKLIKDAFQDYCYWRRNFHPEDSPWVKISDSHDPEFSLQLQQMQQNLTSMLAQLKRSVPFFSPRYLGHMNTDMLMPAVVGYMAAMFYNQNNIVSEAATITLQYEIQAMKMIATMLGMNLDQAWGHLCSGGSSANTESLWIARNLKLLPYQLALCWHEANDDDQRSIIGSLECGKFGSMSDVVENNLLKTLAIDDIIQLLTNTLEACNKNPSLADLVEKNSLAFLGIAKFEAKCREILGSKFPKNFVVLASQNAHYSVSKALGVLGIGKLQSLPLDGNFRLDTTSLKNKINQCIDNDTQILAVVAVYGSTEEASIDDFPKINEIREELRTAGQPDFWLHCDACYGGYALAMLHPDSTDDLQLAEYFRSILPAEIDFKGTWNQDKCRNWQKIARSVYLSDSISIDPHKLGYVPYPAGAVVYKNHRVREMVRCDAPYINAETQTVNEAGQTPNGDHWSTPYFGRYTLEGSRPGAYGAAVWLAHKSIPLNRDGHGMLVAQSVNGTSYLQQTLKQEMPLPREGEEEIGCSFLCENPDLNILCYTFPSRFKNKPVPLALMNRCVERLYEECLPTEDNPTQTRQFVIAMTSLDKEEYGEGLTNLLKSWKIEGTLVDDITKTGNPWRDADSLALIRTVVMGPFLIESITRHRFTDDEEPLVKEYSRFLKTNLLRILKEESNKPISKKLRPKLPGPVLVLEDNVETNEALCEQLREISFKGTTKVLSARNLNDALEILDAVEIIGATIDIDLPQSERGGIEFLKNAVQKESFQGGIVFAVNPDAYLDEINAIRSKFPNKKIQIRRKPHRKEDDYQSVCNEIMSELWKILYSER